MTRIMGLAAAMLVAFTARADVDVATKFSNQGSVANTRHNMTQRQPGGGGPAGGLMTTYRNDYGEVCVYCHTPHGASPVQLPLWNRTIEARPYQTYANLNSTTITQPITAPGRNSLACLSCHDGQTAIDSVINMPGSGRYREQQASSVDIAFLNTWTNASGTTFAHANLTECMGCHSPGAGIVGVGATDFTVFNIGTDLRNDHPVGVLFPASNPDYRVPGGTLGTVRFFDDNANGRPEAGEVRFYDTGDGFEVECSSCHDPHGVPSAGAGTQFNPTFLRIANTGSTLCLTCHIK